MLFARACTALFKTDHPILFGSEHMIESAFRRFLNDEP